MPLQSQPLVAAYLHAGRGGMFGMKNVQVKPGCPALVDKLYRIVANRNMVSVQRLVKTRFGLGIAGRACSSLSASRRPRRQRRRIVGCSNGCSDMHFR